MVTHFFSAIRAAFIALLCLTVAGCAVLPAPLAPDFAQPSTRPSRNFTSFNEALRCMDDLLLARGGRRVLLSSTDIPDKTKKIAVGADDMLINALIRMTAKSQAYVFLDQGLVRDPGLIDLQIVQPEDPPRPDFYVRGSISQLDSSVASVSGSGAGEPGTDPTRTGFTDLGLGMSRNHSVVTVDLHLVGYPSRRIVSGASVSNSMVVQTRRFDGSAAGFIALSGLDLDVAVERIESPGQAVRNLVEVSMIELIGRHARVPYWTCLSLPRTNPVANSLDEQTFHATAGVDLVIEAQQALVRLGRLAGRPNGRIDRATRRAIAQFQADQDLLVNGIVDYDLVRRLRLKLMQRDVQPGPESVPKPVAKPKQTQPEDGWVPLFPKAEDTEDPSGFSSVADFL